MKSKWDAQQGDRVSALLMDLVSRPMNEVLIARPGSRIRVIAVAKTVGLVLLGIGSIVAVIGIFVLVASIASDGWKPFALLVREEVSRGPASWLATQGISAALSGIAVMVAGELISISAEKFIARTEIVTVHSVLAAPKQLATPLLCALDAVESNLAPGMANDLRTALWNVAQQFKDGVSLYDELRATSVPASEEVGCEYERRIDALSVALSLCVERLIEGVRIINEID